MRVYDFKKLNKLYMFGSLNGDIKSFTLRVSSMLPLNDDKKENGGLKDSPRKKKRRAFTITNSTLEDSVIVVNGNLGFNNYKMDSKMSKLEKLNKLLAKNNTYILFMRGNCEDPKVFEEEAINLSNIKTIKDYSVINFKAFNCLCVGGCVSVDREWKKKQFELTEKALYFKGEEFKYNDKEMDEIIKAFDIHCVITSASPSFTFPSTNFLCRNEWEKMDKTLKNDIINERKDMDKLYNKFIENGKKPYMWVYGGYQVDKAEMSNDIMFKSMKSQELTNFNHVVSLNFKVDFSSPIKPNDTVVTNDSLDSLFETAFSFDVSNFGINQEINQEINREILAQINNNPRDLGVQLRANPRPLDARDIMMEIEAPQADGMAFEYNQPHQWVAENELEF